MCIFTHKLSLGGRNKHRHVIQHDSPESVKCFSLSCLSAFVLPYVMNLQLNHKFIMSKRAGSKASKSSCSHSSSDPSTTSPFLRAPLTSPLQPASDWGRSRPLWSGTAVTSPPAGWSPSLGLKSTGGTTHSDASVPFGNNRHREKENVKTDLVTL